jgi:N-acylneuraminate cytidylyltransferase/CMP-N,N'-diacetyllegionaminic acid synthase
LIQNKKVLAFIPARGGSKKLPRKNILNLNNKPLIAWSIKAAENSKYVDHILVSTDDDEILNIAKQYGASAPFKRPARLSMDNSKTIDVMLHAIKWLKNKNEEYDIIVLLQPTSPLRISEDIDNALELLLLQKANAIISVCTAEHNPLWTNHLPEDGRMNNFLDKNILNKNRQELPEFFRLNGAVFVVYVDYLEKNKSFYGENTFAYIMPLERSIDVDNRIDLELCRILLNHSVK